MNLNENVTGLTVILLQGWPPLAEQVKSVLNDYPKLRMTEGRKVTLEWLVVYLGNLAS